MKNLTTCFTFLAAISTAHADNTLLLSEGINLLAVNGKAVSNNGSLFSKANSHQLPNGNNQILVSYTADIKKGSTTELETSQPTVVTFFSEQNTLTIAAPKISNQSSMRKFNQQLNWNLSKKEGAAIKFKAALLPLQGFRLGIDYTEELRKFNRTQNEASIKFKDSMVPNNIAKNNGNDMKKLTSVEAMEQQVIFNMLKHWYKLAAPRTKEQFINEINSN